MGNSRRNGWEKESKAMNTTQKERLSRDEVITADNVRRRGEYLAIRAVKIDLGREGTRFLRTAYSHLLRDINNFDVPGYVLTDSYDIAQEAIAFLCGHIGRGLDDIITDRKGDRTTVLIACFRAVNRYIHGNQRKADKAANFDNLQIHQIEIPFDWDADEMTDYTSVAGKIAAMELSERQHEVLSCKMSGRGTRETARLLSITRDSVQDAVQAARAKYLKVFKDISIS
jgi:DNA-binding CsgD family transcriptional regulator